MWDTPDGAQDLLLALIQRSFLVVLGLSCGRDEHGSAASMASVLPAVLSFWPPIFYF